jgi:hypothetical protein
MPVPSDRDILKGKRLNLTKNPNDESGFNIGKESL